MSWWPFSKNNKDQNKKLFNLKNYRAYYDAATTNRHNQNHWSKSSGYDADSLLIPNLQTIRDRARMEMSNNPHAIGMARKYANYVVGTGPTLQAISDDEEINKIIEDNYWEWCEECDYLGESSFAEILRMGVMELFPAGEFFIIDKSDNKQIGGSNYRLLMIDPARVSTPWSKYNNTSVRDGIEIDADGRKIAYYILGNHPDSIYETSNGETTPFSADLITHTYIHDRPGQHRGLPLMTQCLEIFAKIRRVDDATIRAMEVAASFAAYILTGNPTLTGTNPEDQEPSEIEIEPGMIMTLPTDARDVKQVSPEHPGTTYDGFKKSKLMDCGAGIEMPYNILASDSSDHNYSSGRLDWQGFIRAIDVTRSWLSRKVCKRVFNKWYEEARLSIPYLKKAPKRIPVEFRYPGFEHVDPLKEANAAEIRLSKGMETYAEYHAKRGQDWREVFEQEAIEKKERDRLGISVIEKGNTINNSNITNGSEDTQNVE